MSRSFNRTLSSNAYAAAAAILPALRAVLPRPGSVELRTGDSLSLYFRGRRALHLVGLGGASASVQPFDEKLRPLAGADLQALLRAAVERIDRRTNLRGDELDVQAQLCAALDGDESAFVVVDQQVAVPRDALTLSELEGLRVDLLLAERATGDLWLVEVKLADADDLDGPVLDQLDRTARLPGALRGGIAAFVAHARTLLDQKRGLELVSGVASPLGGRVRTALVAIGDAGDAMARCAMWPAEVEQSDHHAACLPVGAPLVPSAAEPLGVVRSRALGGPRRPYLPQKPRWNQVTAAEDERQRQWRARAPHAHQLGPLHAGLEAWLSAHDAPSHTDLDHPRSSQAACLQLFAPVLLDEPGARQALAALFDVRLGVPAGVRIAGIRDVAFEAPHARPCRTVSCRWRADMRTLVGERERVTTRLDVLIEAETRTGEPVWVGVEFKYTEPEFGACGGFSSPRHTEAGRRACAEDSADRAKHCHLLHVSRRSYLRDRSLFAADPLSASGPCPLLGSLNQLYRSHSVVRAWASGAPSLFVVVRHERNVVLVEPERGLPGYAPRTLGPIERYRASLRPDAAATVSELTVADVLAAYHAAGLGETSWSRALVVRYA